MSTICPRWPTFILFLAASLPAQETLPPGALARLGSMRFRQPDTITALALTPDGKLLFAGGSSGHIRVWDVEAGKLLRTLDVHTEEVRGLAVTPDGKTLISASFDRTLRLWSLKDFKQTEDLETHDDCIEALALSPDGTLLATAGRDHRVGFWTLPGNQRWLKGHENGVCCVAFSPDSKLLTSGSLDRTVRLWDTQTQKMRNVLKGHEGSVDAIAFSSDGKILASAGTGGVVHLWDVSTGKEANKIETKLLRVWSLAFTRDGKTLLVGGNGGRDSLTRQPALSAWDINTREPRWKRHAHPPGTLPPGRTDFRTPIEGTSCIVLTPDGKKAITAGADGRIRFWNPVTGADLASDPGHDDIVTGVLFLDFNRVLVTASLDGCLCWWDAVTSKVTRRIEVGQGQTIRLAGSRAGKLLATAGRGDMVRLWDAGSGTKHHEIRTPGRVAAIGFSPDGRTLATAVTIEKGSLVVLWDTKGKEVRRLEGLEEQPLALAFSNDGKTLAAVSADEPIRVWDVTTGQSLDRLVDRLRGVLCLDWSPDDTAFAGGFNGSRSIVLWDRHSRKARLEFTEEGTDVLGLAFAPDGHSLAAVHADNILRLWETGTGKERRGFKGHMAPMTSVAFSPDGRLIATSSADQTVLLWDRLRHEKNKDGLSIERRQYYWRDLAGEDASRAHDAICALVSSPEQTVDFLRPRLGALPKLDGQRIAKWISDLDARSFRARENAMENLERLGRLIDEQLKRAQEGKLSLEARKRIEELRRRMSETGPAESWKQLERAIEVLELIGTEEARKLIEKIAEGGDFRPTRTARFALERLKGKR